MTMRGTSVRRFWRGTKHLLGDKRGNVMFLTAAAIVPVIGMVGSAVDIGRAYMAQLRLQQACDAGVLAGRRAMAGGTYGTDQKAEANKMFNFNYPGDIYGSSEVRFDSLAASGTDVTGTANAHLPTSLMKIFGFKGFDLAANCAAKLEISNTDVMLVLDVTGSMRGTRIAALKNASKIFLTTLMSADVGDGRVRVGVVPYSATVNIGKILYDANPAWLSSTVQIPSRKLDSSYQKTDCDKKGKNCVTRTIYVYKYMDRDFSVGSLAPGSSFTSNTGVGGANVTAAWGGCAMERKTTPFGPTSTAPDDAYDMDIDLVPTANDDTKWKLFFPDFAYSRSSTNAVTSESDDDSFARKAASGDQGACPSEVMNLTVMDDAGKSQFNSKIDALVAKGFTYHDAGMVWGARLISPDGLFASENATAKNGRPIGRHIIFMTDGDMNTPRSNYSHQGQELSIPRIGATGDSNAILRHNNRFVQLCNKAKAKGIILWAVGFGGDIAEDSPLDLCASDGRAFRAGTDKELEDRFRAIAGQISKLRLSQ